MKTISVTFWYAILSLGFIIVLVFELSFFTNRVQSNQTNTTSLKNEISILQSRLAALQSARPKVTDAISKTTDALPSDNSALLVTSQIRHLALDSQMEIKNINLSAVQKPDAQGIGSMQVSFTVTGQIKDMLTFFDNIVNSAPLLSFDSISLLSSETQSICQVSINSFWSPLPTELPSITDPLVSLSGEEETLLEKVKSLKAPVFVTGEQQVSSTSGQIKADPFSSI
jgi:Tfp pilus assembly protein PilO